MTNRGPAARRSQNSSSHPSIEVVAPWMRRIGGAVRSPKAWTQRSTPLARTILSLASVGRTWGPGAGGCCSGTRELSPFAITASPFDDSSHARGLNSTVGLVERHPPKGGVEGGDPRGPTVTDAAVRIPPDQTSKNTTSPTLGRNKGKKKGQDEVCPGPLVA